MIRILIALVAVLAPGEALAQLITRPPVRPSRPQPAGVIPAPVLPLAGSPTPPGFATARSHPRPYLTHNPYFGAWGYAPLWPVWYPEPPVVVNNIIPVPVPTLPPPTPAAEPPAPELRARLSLTLPERAKVWMAGKEVDARATPVLLESPVLQPGQSYTFDLKLTWPGESRTEERERSVTVAAGDSKGLSFFK